MELISCKNCCHNPLQLGPVGTSFGYCTRHHLTLLEPQSTTCGQLFRKDLLAPAAVRAREQQRKIFSRERVGVLAQPDVAAADVELAEQNGHALPDPVVEEVHDFGLLDSKIASMAALHRVAGVRAEVAMLSLGRGYFQNCREHGGHWTAGVHLLKWTMRRLFEDPTPLATDLHGPTSLPLQRLTQLAKWQVIAFRLSLVTDVAEPAAAEEDPVGDLRDLARKAMEQTQAGSPESLLSWLRRQAPRVNDTLTDARYDELRRSLHKESDA